MLGLLLFLTLWSGWFLGCSSSFSIISSYFSNFCFSHTRDTSNFLSFLASFFLTFVLNFKFLLLTSPCSSPSNLMRFSLLFIKFHASLVNIEFWVSISGNKTNASTWVNFLFTKLTNLCSNNHCYQISFILINKILIIKSNF